MSATAHSAVVPNTFIIGAPKCGTTALSEYLRGHPAVFVSQPKEPNFFCEDLPKTRAFTTLESYLAIFADAQERHTVVAEASTWYLYSRVALARIRDFNPAARIIAMIRSPVDLAYSLHSQLVFNGIEPEQDFETAWRLQPQRPERPFLQYGRVASFGEQLERAYAIFPRDQILVIRFDHFRSETRAVYTRVLDFLGLPDDGRRSFPRVNENKRNRSGTLARTVRRTPGPVNAALAIGKRWLGVESIGLSRRLLRWNMRVEPRPPLPPALRDELVTYFAADLARAARVLGVDLREWRDGNVDGADGALAEKKP